MTSARADVRSLRQVSRLEGDLRAPPGCRDQIAKSGRPDASRNQASHPPSRIHRGNGVKASGVSRKKGSIPAATLYAAMVCWTSGDVASFLREASMT
jgi:hypothetical protein